jgi:hypothetical protein
MERIGEHVWWLPPGPPDRPSPACGVVSRGDEDSEYFANALAV